MSTVLERQNQVIIALLARSTVGIEYIEKIVRGGKQKGKPDDFVRAYNELDGTKTITEIAKLVGVSKQNLSQVLQRWEEKGIVYNVGTGSRTVYAGLLKLPTKGKNRSAAKGIKAAQKPKTRKASAHSAELPVTETPSEQTVLTNNDESQSQ
jgi:hypothetical protein